MTYLIRGIENVSPVNITCGVMKKFSDSNDSKNMDMVHVTIKDETKKHYHKKTTEIYYVIKGSLELDIDGKKEHLAKGQMVMIFPETPHKAWKTSEEDAEILVICSPSWSEEDEILLEK